MPSLMRLAATSILLASPLLQAVSALPLPSGGRGDTVGFYYHRTFRNLLSPKVVRLNFDI